MERYTGEPEETSFVSDSGQVHALEKQGISTSATHSAHSKKKVNSHKIRESVLDHIMLMKLKKKQNGFDSSTKQDSQDIARVSAERVDEFIGLALPEVHSNGECVLNITEKKNKRKRGMSCHAFKETANDFEQNLKTENVDDTGKECRKRVGLIGKHHESSLHGCASITDHDEKDVGDYQETRVESSEEPVAMNCKFQALSARPSISKTSGRLFGMMNKISDRRKHVCNECGRSFNQLRVLTIHQQMHTAKRVPFIQNDEKDKVSVIPECDTPAFMLDERGSRGETSALLECSMPVTSIDEQALRVEASTIHEIDTPDINDDQSLKNEALAEREDKISVEAFVSDSRKSSCERNKSFGESEQELMQSRNYLEDVSENHIKSLNNVKVKKQRVLHHEEASPKQKGHRCDECGKVFSVPAFLRRHSIVHTGEKRFSCPICGKKFGQKASLQRHQRMHARNKQYVVNVSSGLSSTYHDVDQKPIGMTIMSNPSHERIILDTPKAAEATSNYECEDPKIKAYDGEQLEIDLEMLKTVKDRCNDEFEESKNTEAYDGEQLDWGMPKAVKGICNEECKQSKNKEFFAKEQLEMETKQTSMTSGLTTSGLQPFKETAILTDKICLELTETTKTVCNNECEEADSKGVYIGKQFDMETDPKSVNSEFTTYLPQGKEPKKYMCLICEKTFLQRSHLSRHNLSHTGERPFKCKECGKGFSQKSTCQRHERTHSGDVLFICPECGNGFAQKSGLQKHRLIHTGEKPYKCQFCESRFTQKTTCQRHERVHTGEKPYVCQQCGRAFGQSTSLERHMKTHSPKDKIVV